MARINKESIDRFYDYDIYPETRTIYMGSVGTDSDDSETGTDYAMAERLIKGLHILDSSAPNGDKPITILMNNLGGDKYHGIAIHDAIKACKNHVTIIGLGYVMSMGAVIMQAADKRIISPNTRVMLHYGTWSGYGHPKEMYKWADEGKKYDAMMELIFLERLVEKNPDTKLKKIRDMLEFDTILSAQEAVELGLIDEILL